MRTVDPPAHPDIILTIQLHFSGFVQSYGLKNADNTREEFVKPIMFSGGIGYMPHSMIKKNKPDKGQYIIKTLI